MTEQEQCKKQLEEQLEKAKQRLQILDMIEEKLVQMRNLAQKVVEETLTDQEIREIDRQVKDLEQQIRLLDAESLLLS